MIDFDPLREFDKSAIPLGTWLRPVKWNQEGYNLAVLLFDLKLNSYCLRFVQLTKCC